jgi:hypothetical protein
MAVVCVACTAPNPNYHPSVGGGPGFDAPSYADGPPAPAEGHLDPADATIDSAGITPAPDAAAPDAAAPDAAAPDAAAPDTAVPEAPPPQDAALDPAADGAAPPLYSFEASVQGWQDQHADFFAQPPAQVTRTASPTFEGGYSLALTLHTSGTYRTPEIGVADTFGDKLKAGTVITYHVWFPRGGAIEGVQPYVFYYRQGVALAQFGGVDPIIYAANLNAGGWSTVTHRVPADVDSRGVIEVGLEWRTNGPQTVTVFMDAITW